MAAFPFTESLEDLLSRMDAIPIDDSVPFADGFKKVMEEHNGHPWGPQATPMSKLATRLHFAGWTNQQLEQVGLKPKDHENFRRKYKLTQRSAGRPKAAISLPTGGVSALEAAKKECAQLRKEIENLERLIADSGHRIELCRTELKKREEAIKLLS